MSWTANTTPLDGSTGFTLASVSTGTGMVDSAVITSVEDWDNDDFSYGAAVALKQNGTTVIYGKITKVEPYAQGGGAQGRRYTIENAWAELEKVTYKQLFHYANAATTTEQKWRSKVWLGTDDTGARITTLEVIRALLDYAMDIAEVSMSYSISGFGVIAPVTEATDQTVGSLIAQTLRWHPNVQYFWRYTGSSATLHIKPLSALSGVSLTVSEADENDPQPISAQVLAREDYVPPCVIVKYERLNEFSDPETGTISRIEYHEDKAGTGSEHAPGALCFTIELQGLKTTSVVQPVRTRTVPGTYSDDDDPETPSAGTQLIAAKWYQSHIGALKAIPGANIRVDEHLTIFDTNETEETEADIEDSPPLPPEGDPEDYPRELLEGTIQEWMAGVKATPMVARGKFAFKGTSAGFTDDQLRIAKLVFGEALDQERTYYVRYMGTDARTQRYRTMSGFEAAEAWPTGLAAAVYNEMDTVRHEGTVTVRDATCYLGALPGMMLTLVGQTGSGPVQSVSFDPARGVTTIGFGWPGHRTPQDIFELQKASRSNSMTATYAPTRRGAAEASTSGQSVQGALRGPINDVQPTGGGGAALHPFYVRMDGTSVTVQPGTVTYGTAFVPTIGGVPITDLPAPTGTLTGVGAEFVWIKVEATHTSESGYVKSTVVTAVTISGGSTMPTDALDTAIYYIQLASFFNGVKTGQFENTSLNLSFCDNGLAESKANIDY